MHGCIDHKDGGQSMESTSGRKAGLLFVALTLVVSLMPHHFAWADEADGKVALEEEAYLTDDIVIKILTIARIYGDERYMTSREVALYERDISTEQTLIIASGDNNNFPDALAASALSGANGNAPILLTTPWALSEATRDVLERAASASKVYIIGGIPSVSAAAVAEIASILPSAQIERIGGESRMETAELIYSEIEPQASKTAIIARSMDFPDSLSAAPWAAFTTSPIFLTDFSEQGLTQGTLDALVSGGFERLIVMGSELSVPAAVVDVACDAAGLTDGDVVRIGGIDRVGTSLAMAAWATSGDRDADERLSYNNLAVTRSDNHADALAGGALQGAHGSVVLLSPTKPTDPDVLAAIMAAQDDIYEIRFLGDHNALDFETMRDYAFAIRFDVALEKPGDMVGPLLP